MTERQNNGFKTIVVNCVDRSGFVKSTLSAPPKNCDRFNSGDPVKDSEDAYDEWQQLMPPSCKDESSFRQWLFATPDEKEGGTEWAKR